MINFDFSHIEEDEDSEYICQEINKLKMKNITNNIDFSKAELEKEELESKLKAFNKTKVTKLKENNNSNSFKNDENLIF